MHLRTDSNGKANMLKGNGTLGYSLSIDIESGKKWISIVSNSNAGTHAKGIYFAMDEVKKLVNGTAKGHSALVRGVRADGTSVDVKNCNVPGFLKAIKKAL